MARQNLAPTSSLERWRKNCIVPYSQEWFNAYQEIYIEFPLEELYSKYPDETLKYLKHKYHREWKQLSKFSYLTKNLDVYQEPGSARQELIKQQQYSIFLLTDLTNLVVHFEKYQKAVGLELEAVLEKREKIREKRRKRREKKKRQTLLDCDW